MTGNNWAIVVGLNQYKYHAEFKLNYAINDAELVKSFLCNYAGFATDHVLLCLGEAANREHEYYPTYGNLLHLLDRVLSPKRTGHIDRLWFFFAGHGLSRNGQDYLLTADSLVGDIDLRIALRVEELTALLRCHEQADIVLILDNCRTLVGSRNIGAPTEPATSEQTLQLSRERGITTIFGCDYGQVSHELPTLQHGTFTYALVEGLKKFTLPITLEAYLQRRVPELNAQANHWAAQTPHIKNAMSAQAVRPLLPLLSSQELDELLSMAAQAAEKANLEEAKVLWQKVFDLAPLSQQGEEARRGFERIGEQLQPQSERKPKQVIPITPTLSTFAFDVITVNKHGQETRRKCGQAQYFSEDFGLEVVLEMVSIPGGSFVMGSPVSEKKREDNEGPQHVVTVEPFFIGKYPVTQEQWLIVAALSPIKHALDLEPSKFKGDNRPVEQISWLEAAEFCERLSRETGREYRLPSEAEWEYACRAGTTTPFHFGETIATDLANYDVNTTFTSGKGINRGQTTVVGRFPPNAFGLYDMHGNVEEWCLDQWHENYEGAPIYDSAWLEGSNSSERLLRGGSWICNSPDCRSARRYCDSPDYRFSDIGFRVVCSAP